MVVKVHDLPVRMTSLDAEGRLSFRDVSIDDVLPEAARAFGAAPETGCWVKRQDGCPTASVRLTFKEESLKATPRSVVVLGARLKAEYPSARGVRPPQCQKCWGLHRPDACKTGPRCRICGDAGHATIEHPMEGPAKCVNCGGGHTADSPSCPKAAPVLRKAPKDRLRRAAVSGS